jgi:DNA-binding LacI/PurR family transcriptional regulator
MVQDRLQGFRQAAEEAGFDWRDVTVASCAFNDTTEAERITSILLTSPKPPDAIAAMTDQLAAGAIRAARAAGRRVPQDLAVTGWDDAAVAGQLGITTVALSLRDQGAACAHAALGQPFARHTTSWQVVCRGSTRLQETAKDPYPNY